MSLEQIIEPERTRAYIKSLEAKLKIAVAALTKLNGLEIYFNTYAGTPGYERKIFEGHENIAREALSKLNEDGK